MISGEVVVISAEVVVMSGEVVSDFRGGGDFSRGGE